MARTRFINVRSASDFGNTAKSISISGFDNIIKNLSAFIVEKGLASKRGLLEVAKEIRRDMESPEAAADNSLVPKDIGNLDLSWTVKPRTEGKQHGITFGFSAGYALWVHEMVGPDIKWKRDGSGPKFLQKSLDRNHDTIIQILVDNLKI